MTDLLWKPMFHFLVHNTPPLDPILESDGLNSCFPALFMVHFSPDLLFTFCVFAAERHEVTVIAYASAKNRTLKNPY
jgi:hypothetical protein